MKHRLKRHLENSGVMIARYASAESLRSALKKLHPVTTDVALVRFGSDADGGYLVPDDLDGVVACFSPGVDIEAGFEKVVAARGIPCFLADASVPEAPVSDPLFKFEKKFLGLVDDADTLTLDTWVQDNAPAGDLLLQMDIEGAEWSTLINVSDETLKRFRIIIVEFHYIDKYAESNVFMSAAMLFERLSKYFYIVHNHPNNNNDCAEINGVSMPRLFEITMLRKDRATVTGFANVFPHPLDRPNISGREDVILPADWYRGG